MKNSMIISLICVPIASSCISLVSGVLIKKFLQSRKLQGRPVIYSLALSTLLVTQCFLLKAYPRGVFLAYNALFMFIGHRFCPLAITGSIGSGKTTFSKFLKENGFHIIDADVIARQVLQPNKPAYEQIVKLFGNSILNNDSTIDRSTLRKIIFEDGEKRKKLNSITHYYIIKEMLWQIFKHRILYFSDKIIVDASLLFETHFDFLCCPIITIAADRDIQIERILARDESSSLDTISNIINSQSSTQYKTQRSDLVISNNSTILDFELKIRAFFRRKYNVKLMIISKCL